jgi:hypothetical protein
VLTRERVLAVSQGSHEPNLMARSSAGRTNVFGIYPLLPSDSAT